jgi:hypothetical protein
MYRESKPHDVVISQKVVNPIGNECNTDSGNPAALTVPANVSKVFSQNVVNPSVMVPARGKYASQ